MEKQGVSVFNQLLRSFEEAEIRFEESYKKKDYDSFAKSKKIILEIQNKILEEII
jgi:hypothetical protein